MAFADKFFGNYIRDLSATLDAMSMRQQVIVNNIANASTPGFVPQTVAFEDTFRQILEDGDGAVALEGSEPEHITAQQANWSSSPPSISSQDGPMDLHKEMVKMAQNQIMFNAISSDISGTLGASKAVIDGFGR